MYFVLLDISALTFIIINISQLSQCQRQHIISISAQYQHQYQYIFIYFIHQSKHQQTFSKSARALWLWSGVLGRARQGRRASTSCSGKQVISNMFSFLFLHIFYWEVGNIKLVFFFFFLFAHLVPGSR